MPIMNNADLLLLLKISRIIPATDKLTMRFEGVTISFNISVIQAISGFSISSFEFMLLVMRILKI